MEENKDQSQGDENALEKPAEPGEFNALENLSAASEGEVHQEGGPQPDSQKPKKGGKLRKLWGKLNVYLLIFFLLIVIAGIVFIVSYINSQKEPEFPEVGLQDLTQEELSEIASGDASVGDPRYVLNIQSDAVFAGSALIRGDLNVAGSVQLGQALTIPALSVSGNASFGDIQAGSLALAEGATIQGELIVQDDGNFAGELTVGGSATISGDLTAATVTTGKLTIAGSSGFVLSGHLTLNGPTPSRSNGSLGSGGSSSISGSDSAGIININTGGSPSSGCMVNITFNQSFNGTPNIIVTPVGSEAGRLNFYITNRSSNGFSLCSQNAPNAGKNFAFQYFVVN